MKNEKCKESLQKLLDGSGSVDIDVEKGRILIETDVPWSILVEKLESTGRKVALTGFSGGQSAVSMISVCPSPNLDIKGVVRFCSAEKGAVIDGVVDGLEANKKFNFNINECGDISAKCDSIGNELHSNSIEANEMGRSTFRFVDDNIDVGGIIGRSVSITSITNERYIGN